MIIWRIWWLFGKREHVPNFAFAGLCFLKIPVARPARSANTVAVWCEGEDAMVGTQAEDGARDVGRQGWSRVGARACERVPHTPVRSYARTHAHSHALCMCLYVYMFESVSVCTSARSQADHDTMERRRTDAAPETRYCILNTRIAVCLVGLLRIRLIRRQFVNLRIHLTAVGWDRICSKSKPKVMENFFSFNILNVTGSGWNHSPWPECVTSTVAMLRLSLHRRTPRRVNKVIHRERNVISFWPECAVCYVESIWRAWYDFWCSVCDENKESSSS